MAGEWVSIAKPDTVNAEIVTSITGGISCSPSFTIDKPLPDGLSIALTATGIILSGTTENCLSHVEEIIKDPLPYGGVELTDYVPSPIYSESWIIMVTSSWSWFVGVPGNTSETLPYKFTVYNRWQADKAAVLALIKE